MEQQQPEGVRRRVRVVYDSRRLVATGLAVGLAILFGYHAVFGQNGLTAYAEKRSEDRTLRTKIDQLAQENARLREHVTHLQSDPDAIEREARERLHYTRPGEVIYSLGEAPKVEVAPSAPSMTRH